jgi:type II secretory pathway predicted ATPase ExeA
MAKKARPVREDRLERQETAQELRERIRVLFKLQQTPDDKTVKWLLSRLENYKQTGYVK